MLPSRVLCLEGHTNIFVITLIVESLVWTLPWIAPREYPQWVPFQFLKAFTVLVGTEPKTIVPIHQQSFGFALCSIPKQPNTIVSSHLLPGGLAYWRRWTACFCPLRSRAYDHSRNKGSTAGPWRMVEGRHLGCPVLWLLLGFYWGSPTPTDRIFSRKAICVELHSRALNRISCTSMVAIEPAQTPN